MAILPVRVLVRSAGPDFARVAYFDLDSRFECRTGADLRIRSETCGVCREMGWRRFAGEPSFDSPAIANQLFVDQAANRFHQSSDPICRANRSAVNRGRVDFVLFDSDHSDPPQRDAARSCARARSTRSATLVQDNRVSGRGRTALFYSKLVKRFHGGSLSKIFGAKPLVFCFV